MKNIFVFANNAGNVAELTAGAKTLGEKVSLITCGESYGSADAVYKYSAEASVAALLNDIAAAVAGADLLLCETSRDGRLVGGYVAAKMGTSPLCDASSLEIADGVAEITRLVYGGAAIKIEKAPLPAVVTAGAGLFEPGEVNDAVEVFELAVSACEGIELMGTSELEAPTLNLAAAKRVVGVGRGLCSADNIPVLEAVAAALDAEIGCTRPVTEEEHWYGRERYIGVSGVMLKPNFYMAVGISGQIQHTVGINTSNVIFCIDKNENAPMISQSDYALIGDVNTVLPALLEKLKQ
ncbi:MAG: electron transfer flavoprotein subunit alpha/FixB family protein [Candidatus Scatomorpha sp.]|jgi:electron transfer flavoprotein alpha subunit